MNELAKDLGQAPTGKDFSALVNALNQAAALISITDSQGYILYANERFVEASKYTLSELTDHNHRILQTGDYLDESHAVLWNTITQGKVWRGKIKNRAKDGSFYWVDTSIAPVLDERGKPERHIGIGFLISDREELEEDRNAQIQDLEKMNKFMVGRELKMVELKEKIKALEKHV